VHLVARRLLLEHFLDHTPADIRAGSPRLDHDRVSDLSDHVSETNGCAAARSSLRQRSASGIVRRVQHQRARGDSLRKIAEDLNTAGVPTAQGGARWYRVGAQRAAAGVVTSLAPSPSDVIGSTGPAS
jgi:hypothetical protein